ncbi:MAG: hypothetical protein MJE68_07450 [Proteobacteria bacterium]|nr:hypothetical protein [Pseudomonadota bacterium]
MLARWLAGWLPPPLKIRANSAIVPIITTLREAKAHASDYFYQAGW